MELLLLLVSVFCVSGEPIKFLAEDATVNRQASYTTNVIHQNPNYPDQHAESSINVDFNPQRARPNALQPKQPRTLQNYHQQQLPYPEGNFNTFNTLPHPQSQSFNVGYSVSFTGNNNNNSPPPSIRSFPKLENPEIITGSRKDSVRKPLSDFDSNEYVSHALIDLKKQKVSGLKPKLHKFPKDNEAKKFIDNLAPQTQQFLSYLGDSNKQQPPNIRPRQQPTTQGDRHAWTNLSPSVEIYHSPPAFSPKEQLEQSKRFDHRGALGKSQGFDYSNALEGQIEQQQPYFKIQEGEENAPPKFSVDVSLLRDPILTPTGRKLPSDDPRILSIPFDTTLLQAMQQKLAQQPHEQTQLIQPILVHQPYDGQQQVFEYGQAQTFPPEAQDFNSYGSSYPKNNFDQTYDYAQPQSSKRYPNGGRVRTTKSIQTNLQPPPLPRHRRMHVGVY